MEKEELLLARKRLAFEIRQKRIENRRAEAQTLGGWRVVVTPTGAAVAGAVLALLGTAAGKWADYLATCRQQETNIILKASEVPASTLPEDQETIRARNLLFFLESDFIHLSSDVVAHLRSVSNLKGRAAGPPAVQPQSSVPPFVGDELEIANRIQDLVKKKSFSEAAALFEPLQKSHFSGVGYSAYPDVALALDQDSTPDKAVQALDLLAEKLKQDAANGYGFLAPGRPPLKWVASALSRAIPQVHSPEVKKRMEEIRAQMLPTD